MHAFSQSSEYALRALTLLAQRREQGYQLGRDMAEALGIRAPYLAKVLQPLVSRGVLESQRGRGGGFRLRLPPERVTLYQIVDSQEDLLRARRCSLGQSVCTDEQACPMHEYWKRTSEDFLQRLHERTLKEIVDFCERRPESGYPAVRRDEP